MTKELASTYAQIIPVFILALVIDMRRQSEQGAWSKVVTLLVSTLMLLGLIVSLDTAASGVAGPLWWAPGLSIKVGAIWVINLALNVPSFQALVQGRQRSGAALPEAPDES